MLLSRVLRHLLRLAERGIKHTIRHPVKSLLFILKFYFLALLFVFFLTFSLGSFAQTIYDSAPSSPTTRQFDCSSATAQANARFSEFEQQVLDQLASNRRASGFSGPRIGRQNEGLCEYLTGTYTSTELFPDGTVRFTQTVGYGRQLVFTPEFNDSCESDDGVSTTRHILNTQNGQPACFSPFDLANSDSCPSTPTSPDFVYPANAVSGTPETICLPRQDGSQCAYSLDSSGDFYSPNFEVNCYGDGLPLTQPIDVSDDLQDEPEGCVEADGQRLCIGDIDTECTGDSCTSGCGFIDTVSGNTEFVCVEPMQTQGDDTQDDAQDDSQDGQGDGNTSTDTSTDANGNVNVTVNVGTQSIVDQLTTDQSVDFSIPEDIRKIREGNDYDSRNYGTVITSAVDRMKEAPVFKAAETFFQVSLNGTCPTYSADVPIFGVITMDHLCRPVMQNIWPIIRAIVILTFSFYAFRVAVL